MRGLVCQCNVIIDVGIMEFMSSYALVPAIDCQIHLSVAQMQAGVAHRGAEREDTAHRNVVNIVAQVHETSTFCKYPASVFGIGLDLCHHFRISRDVVEI